MSQVRMDCEARVPRYWPKSYIANGEETFCAYSKKDTVKFSIADKSSYDDGDVEPFLTGELLDGNTTEKCPSTKFCYALWQEDYSNKNATVIVAQGCWSAAEFDCSENACISTKKPQKAVNNTTTKFCCCKGNMCNVNVSDGFFPSDENEAFTKIVNLISSQALNKRKFDALLGEVNSVYNGLIMYKNVHWLSRGNVLQRFVGFLEEIRLFLQNESKIEQYPQLMDIMWLLKLMFFTDICQHLNELNIKLQGPNKTVIVMMYLIRAFEAKLYVFRSNIITKNYKYFSNLKKNIKDLDAQEKRNEEKVIDDFISIMDSLIKEFSARFSQFKELSEMFKFIMYPYVIWFDKLNLSQFDWLEIEELEMQLIEFQSSSIWIQKFIEARKKLELIKAERLTSNISKKIPVTKFWKHGIRFQMHLTV
ncbi:general transcription factor II-I repeat domain-containing protein 2A [Trichonephila clavipes]|nr:general transcription factor II-I repeat domain-containing protein 2A [Trichonephila clavipes]